VAGASIACNGKLFLANFSVLCVDVPDARNCDNSIRLVRGVCWGVQGSQSPGWSVHLQPLSASIHHPLLATPFSSSSSCRASTLLHLHPTPLSGPQPPHLVPCPVGSAQTDSLAFFLLFFFLLPLFASVFAAACFFWELTDKTIRQTDQCNRLLVLFVGKHVSWQIGNRVKAGYIARGVGGLIAH